MPAKKKNINVRKSAPPEEGTACATAGVCVQQCMYKKNKNSTLHLQINMLRIWKFTSKPRNDHVSHALIRICNKLQWKSKTNVQASLHVKTWHSRVLQPCSPIPHLFRKSSSPTIRDFPTRGFAWPWWLEEHENFPKYWCQSITLTGSAGLGISHGGELGLGLHSWDLIQAQVPHKPHFKHSPPASDLTMLWSPGPGNSESKTSSAEPKFFEGSIIQTGYQSLLPFSISNFNLWGEN